MKKYLLFIIINFILLTMQNSFLIEFFGQSINPDLILALVFALFFADSDNNALVSGFIGGLLLDLNGTSIVGTSLLYLVSVIYLTVLFRKTVFKGFITQAVFLFISVVLYKMIFTGFTFSLTWTLLLSGLLSLLISLFLFLIISRLQNRFLSIEYRIKA